MMDDDEDNEISRADLVNFLGEFLTQNKDSGLIYRGHLCKIIVGRVFEEFGPEGLCELMMQIDRRAGWISDIIFEQSDFNNALFAKYMHYDEEIVDKARNSQQLLELNKKIWRLRKKYAGLIIDEIMDDELELAELEKEEGEN
jgi:hypothetical protein